MWLRKSQGGGSWPLGELVRSTAFSEGVESAKAVERRDSVVCQRSRSASEGHSDDWSMDSQVQKQPVNFLVQYISGSPYTQFLLHTWQTILLPLSVRIMVVHAAACPTQGGPSFEPHAYCISLPPTSHLTCSPSHLSAGFETRMTE